MQIIYTARFRRSYRKAPDLIKRAFDRKVPTLFDLTLQDFLQHPGFRPEK